MMRRVFAIQPGVRSLNIFLIMVELFPNERADSGQLAAWSQPTDWLARRTWSTSPQTTDQISF
jgi:hypothetical protein